MSKVDPISAYRKQRKRIRHEVENRLDSELTKYTSKISELVGEPFPPKPVLTKTDLDAIHKKIDSIVTLAISDLAVEWDRLPAEEIWRRIQDFFDKLLRQYIKVPSGEKALPYLRKDLEQFLRPRFDNAYQAVFYEVSEAGGWLIQQLFMQDRITDAQSFFSKFAKSAEAFSLGQIYVQTLLPSVRRVGRFIDRKPQRKAEIQSLIREYSTIAGVYEKICRVILVLNRIRLNKPIDYDDIGRIPLARILRELQEAPQLKPITSKLNTRIRNAIAHPSYRIYYSKQRVRFDRETDMTWNQFSQKTIHLSIALTALTITPFIHYLQQALVMLEAMFVSGTRA